MCECACDCVCLLVFIFFQGKCGWHVSHSFMLQSSQHCMVRALLWLCGPWGSIWRLLTSPWMDSGPGSGLALHFHLRACQTVLAWAASLYFGTSRFDATRTAGLQKLNMGLSGSFWASLDPGWVWGTSKGSEATLVYCWPWIMGMPTIIWSRQPPQGRKQKVSEDFTALSSQSLGPTFTQGYTWHLSHKIRADTWCVGKATSLLDTKIQKYFSVKLIGKQPLSEVPECCLAHLSFLPWIHHLGTKRSVPALQGISGT